MRGGLRFRFGPLWASTGPGRARGVSPDVAMAAVVLAVVVAFIVAVPSAWRWPAAAAVAVLGLTVAWVVSSERDAARSRAAVEQEAAITAANRCKPGDRVRLVSAKYAAAYEKLRGSSVPQPGDLGTVTGTDDWGVVKVQWDNGSDFGLVAGADQFELVRDAEGGRR
ncbi:MAG TPA: DUF4314 domain-containing protein [Streptosporangiaceae bacterium]|nr:DUF4314 domain-containing protein [Streptosporangiaceae bacterium]